MTPRFSVSLILILFAAVIVAGPLSAQGTSSQTTTTQRTTTQTTQPCVNCPQTTPACTPPCPQTSTSGFGDVVGELYLNAGGIWPNRIGDFDDRKIKAQGIYGLKGGVFFGPSFEIEGSFGYLNHFERSSAPNPLNFHTSGGFGQPSIIAFLYDVNFAYNFGARAMFGTRFVPYVVVGGGGLTAEVRHADSAFFNGGGFVPDFTTGR